jgi:hypothetical protein
MTKADQGAKKSAKRLYRQIWAITALLLFILPGDAFASYNSDIKKAAELWMNVNQQDALYFSGKISKEEWNKENSYFFGNFRRLKNPLIYKSGGIGGSPERFAKEFPKAVAKRLGIKNSPTASLLAIKAAPKGVSLDAYRRDIWRAAEIQAFVNRQGAARESNLGAERYLSKEEGPKEKAMRKEMVDLVQKKYYPGGKPSPVSQMFFRNYNAMVSFEHGTYMPNNVAVMKPPDIAITNRRTGKTLVIPGGPEDAYIVEPGKSKSSSKSGAGEGAFELTPDQKALLVLLVPVALIILAFVPGWRFKRKVKADTKQNLLAWGDTPEARFQSINAYFDDATGSIFHRTLYRSGFIWAKNYIDASIYSSLMVMPERVREALRSLELYNNEGALDQRFYRLMRFGLIYNDGNAAVDRHSFYLDQELRIENLPAALSWYSATEGGLSTESCIHSVTALVQQHLNENPDSQAAKALRPRYASGEGMLSLDDVANSDLFVSYEF